ncbi:MAG: RNA polymerase sigma factor [Planctomycetes bacterium]|nr:RNA polymerase sigma factor [Planctomycetota bacterium]MBL7039883.1 RNA polymerase sigma factor [Pirellulaceae bacterium]
MTETSLSLLDRICRHPDDESWQRLVDVYTPLLHGWLRRYDAVQPADADDLVQEVLLTVTRELPQFQHNRRTGAFRNWLRTILVNRLRHFWRSRQRRPDAVGGSDFLGQLNELEDAASGVSRVWNDEHDRHVIRRLLELTEPRFASSTWQAFRRQVMDGASAAAVAPELGSSLHSVYAAKSRVLSTLRQQAEGLVG